MKSILAVHRANKTLPTVLLRLAYAIFPRVPTQPPVAVHSYRHMQCPVIYPLQPISTQIPIRRTSNLDWAFYRSKAKLYVNGFLPWYHQQTASSVLIITPTKLVTRIRDAIKTLVETMINRIANAMSSLLLITASDGGCSIRINC